MADSNKKLAGSGVKEFIWPTILLIVSLILALLSSAARTNGLWVLAITTAVCALISAAVVAVTMIPRLLRRVRLEYWSTLQLFRVTHRGFFFLLLVLMIALSTFNTGNNLLVIVLSFLLAALLVSGMFSNLSLYGLRVHLQIPDSIHAQQTNILIFGLENFKKRIPSFSVTLKGNHSGTAQLEPDFFQTESHFPFIGPRKTVTIPTPCTFEKRGVYPVDAFEVRTQFPFGFFSRGRKLDTLGQITIYPALIPYRELFRRQSALLGSEIWLRKGKGTGLYNIRDYQRGDDARFVSWKSSAKLSRLMVKEFLLEEEEFLQLVFSTYLPNPDSNALGQFEKVLSYLTTLSCLFRDRGRRFSFYSGEFRTELNGSNENHKALLDYLAWVQPSSEFKLEKRKIEDGSVIFLAGRESDLGKFPQINYLKL